MINSYLKLCGWMLVIVGVAIRFGDGIGGILELTGIGMLIFSFFSNPDIPGELIKIIKPNQPLSKKE